MKPLSALLGRGKEGPPISVTVEAVDPLQEEREKTTLFLARIREIAPPEGSSVFGFSEDLAWYSPTLKNRMKNVPYRKSGSGLVRSLGSLLEEDTRGCLDLSLTSPRHKSYFWSEDKMLIVRGGGDNKLVVNIDHRNNANVRFATDAFSFAPSIDYVKISWDKSMTPELADQTYANAVLEILTADLEDSRAKWEEQLQQRREDYFKKLEEVRGEDGVWAVKHSLEHLAVATCGEPYMIFAPDPKANDGDEPSPLILYTTANLTQELSEEFSKTGYGMYYYPTTFQSSNARGAKPIMITPLGNGLIVEIRQTESLHRKQQHDLSISFKNFMYGTEDATKFTIFPPDKKDIGGVRTVLLAISPASVKLEKEEQTANS